MIKTIFEEREDIGKAIGRAEGKAEAVLLVLRAKFKRIPKEIEEAIRQMTDLIALESLLVHTVHSETLEEFAAALK